MKDKHHPRRLLALLAVVLTALSTMAADEFVIAIDAGHGGKDSGAQSANQKVNEKDIALSVALRTGEIIRKRHPEVKVVYTRKTDVYVTLNGRADIANKAKADLFVSIHCNAAESRKAYGAEVFVLGTEEHRTAANLNAAKRENSVILLEKDYQKHYQGYDPNSPESSIIFEYLQSEFLKESITLAQCVQNELCSTGGRLDRGVHQAGFLVLHATSMPSILVELGFISHAEEEKFLKSAEGKEKLSVSIANGFDDYYSSLKSDAKKAETDKKKSSVSPTDNTPQKNIEIEKKTQEVTSTKVEKADAEKTSAQPVTKKEETTNDIIFKVQFFYSSTQLPNNSSKFAGLPDIGMYKENDVFKYTSGNTTSLEEIQTIKKKVTEKYKDAFIVAFRNGKRINTTEAINEYKSKH